MKDSYHLPGPEAVRSRWPEHRQEEAFICSLIHSFTQEAFLSNDYDQASNWVPDAEYEKHVAAPWKELIPSGINLVLTGARFHMLTNLFLFFFSG